MNKKFNLLALAAAASACGALVLTSCGGGGKTHIVLFKTDGLRDTSDPSKLTPVSFKAQTVKHGKKMRSPIDLGEAEAKDYARITWRDDTSGNLEYRELPLRGWSESTEDEADGDFDNRSFGYETPITYDTVLYPLYSTNKVHCLTLNLRYDSQNYSTWREETCVASHVWEENWFETGTSLKNFESKTYNCVKPLATGEISEWRIWNSTDHKYVTFDWDIEIKEDITLVAYYSAK